MDNGTGDDNIVDNGNGDDEIMDNGTGHEDIVDNGHGHEGIVLICDEQSLVQQVVYDGLGLKDQEITGHPLTSLVERSALEKTLNFLTTTRIDRAVFNWRIAVPLPRGLQNLFFAGMLRGEDILVVAAVNRMTMMRLVDRFATDEDTVLDAAVRSKIESFREQGCQDDEFYEDFTRLNNELANLQRELHKKNVDLQKLDQLKNQFLGMAAHDLRSPLVTVDMYCSFLMDELADRLSDEEKEYLSIIRSSSTYMLDLVNDLLDIARIESGKLQLVTDEGDIHELVLRVIKLNRAPASRKKLDILLQADDELPLLCFDSLRIEQVMHNLLNNAIKFSYPESRITVKIHKTHDAVLLSVQDEGTGIAEEEKQRLFDMFEHAKVRGTAGEKSTGLGLAIAQKIVLAHGGKIWVESEKGRGTTLFFTLPQIVT